MDTQVVKGLTEEEVKALADKETAERIAKMEADAIAARTFTISEDAYTKLLEVTETADTRGLNSSMEYYVNRFIIQAAKVTLGLWNKSDNASMLQMALKGNNTAKLAVLTSLYGKDKATALINALPK